MTSLHTTAPLPLRDPLIGTMVGEYRVESVLGEGGMGLVYRGLQPVIGKQVAIKVLKRPPGEGSDTAERLIAEARAVNAIKHRGIIDIFSLGLLPDGRPYVVMELLDGEALDARLARLGRLPWREAARLTLELCAPLEAAHRAGVIHRDMKPANAFVCREASGAEYVKLLDFGLARRTEGFDASTEQTKRASIIGTPNYLAPEQATGAPVSARTDVYALGVMLFEFLTATLPFTGPGALEVAYAHVHTPPPRLEERLPDARPELAALVADMLAKEPSSRPAIDAVRLRLQALLDGPVITNPGHLAATRPVTVLQRPAAPPRRKVSTHVVAGAALTVVVAGLGLALALQPGDEPDPSPVAAPQEAPAPAPPEPPPPLPEATAPPPAPAVEPQATPASAPAPTPGRRAPPAPTIDALVARTARLEMALRARAGAAEPDGAALQLLKTYRLKAEMADAPAARLEVSRKLDRWETSHLR